MYSILRTTHLICGVLSLPFLLMYGISAVQMAHSAWFSMKPAVHEKKVTAAAGLDARGAARRLTAHGVRGELSGIRETPAALAFRVTVPGTVHEVGYEPSTGQAQIRTSVAGTLGMLNRLHHAAGLYHEHVPLKLWGVAVAVVSLGTVGLGATGLLMWWMRRQERTAGLVLLAANLLFSLMILGAMRAAGP